MLEEPECLVIAIFPPGTPGVDHNDEEFVWCQPYPLMTAMAMAKSLVQDDGALWVEVSDSEGKLLKQCAQADVLDPWREA